MTLFEVYKQSLKSLKNPDVEEINIRILLGEINQLKTMSDFYLRKDEEIHDLPRFQEYFERYLEGEPVQYILGKTSFLGCDILVDKRVLIPRQESEEVVQFTIKKSHEIFGNKNISILDVCCGSGAMGIALTKQLNAERIYFSDISNDALDVCSKNLKANQVSGDIFEGDALTQVISKNIKVDLLISNPPYILKSEPVDESVLKYEPHLSLFADNNFSIYEKIISNLNAVKNDQLLAVFEIGINSKNPLENMVRKYHPQSQYGFIKDINGKERILYIYLK